jgi:AcrR family transcriptional regulator
MTDDVDRGLPQGTGTPVTIPDPIFLAAVDTFVAGQRLDMRSLARRVGMARATLYRRAGNREQLLDQVLWWRARLLLAGQVRASDHLTGTDRLTAMTGGVLRAIGTDRPVRLFLESDPETALRLMGFADTAINEPVRHLISAAGIPLMTADEVADALLAILASDRTGEAWYVQPGRPAEPFAFRNVPGPRAPDGSQIGGVPGMP